LSAIELAATPAVVLPAGEWTSPGAVAAGTAPAEDEASAAPLSWRNASVISFALWKRSSFSLRLARANQASKPTGTGASVEGAGTSSLMIFTKILPSVSSTYGL